MRWVVPGWLASRLDLSDASLLSRPSRSAKRRREVIPNRRPIEDRPTIVETRRRIGDWEAATIIGKNHRQAIVSLVERNTGFTLIKKVERKTARAVSHAVAGLLGTYWDQVHAMTPDNGRGFAGHEDIAQHLQADFYFAHPDAFWECGTNENTSGLIRQHFPKNRDFTTITQLEIDTATERLNNRPRKRLGYQTPSQVFSKSLDVVLKT